MTFAQVKEQQNLARVLGKREFQSAALFDKHTQIPTENIGADVHQSPSKKEPLIFYFLSRKAPNPRGIGCGAGGGGAAGVDVNVTSHITLCFVSVRNSERVLLPC